MKKQTAIRRAKRAKGRVFPRGWSDKRVKDVIAYYDRQTEDEEVSEYENAMKIAGRSLMLVPTELVPEIRRLIARSRRA